MTPATYSDAEAAALYDVLNPWGPSDAFYPAGRAPVVRQPRRARPDRFLSLLTQSPPDRITRLTADDTRSGDARDR